MVVSVRKKTNLFILMWLIISLHMWVITKYRSTGLKISPEVCDLPSTVTDRIKTFRCGHHVLLWKST